MRFLVDTLCIFFAFAAGYYKNMVLFTIVALVFWVYCLSQGREKHRQSSAAGGDVSSADKNN